MNSVGGGMPVAMIVGFERNGLGVARALAGAGVHSVGLAAPGRNPCRATRAADRVITMREWSEAACIETLMRAARRLEHRAPLLLTKDEAVLWVARHRSELSAAYHVNLPDDETIALLMSKRRFGERAVAEGWPVPATWFIDDPAAFLRCAAEVTFPCILKPQVKTSEFRRHTPAKAFRARDRRELEDAYRLVAQWEPEVVVQEWIAGEDERVAFCLTYVGRSGEPRVAYAGRKLRQWPVECGNTALAEPAPATWQPALLALTDRIWRATGFRGLGSIEFKMRFGTDEPVITEPTVGRTNFQNELAVLNGVNIPLAAYCDLAGFDVPAPEPRARAVKLVDGHTEHRAAIWYHGAGRLGVATWWRQRRGRKRYMLWRAGDPGPFFLAMLGSARDAASEIAARALPRSVHHGLKTALRRVARAARAS